MRVLLVTENRGSSSKGSNAGTPDTLSVHAPPKKQCIFQLENNLALFIISEPSLTDGDLKPPHQGKALEVGSQGRSNEGLSAGCFGVQLGE